MDSKGAGTPEALIDVLLEAGVVGPIDEGDEAAGLRLTDEFAERIDQCRRSLSELDEADIRAEFTAVIEDGEEVTALLDVSASDEDILAEYLALSRSDVNGLSHADRLRVMTMFDALGRSPPPDDGAPDPFVPVEGNRLPFLLQLYPRAIVYVWLDDCSPCDLMKESFEKLLADPSDELALFAVYGPDSSVLLQERYDVVGGPATLFVLDGQVDARLYGAHYETVIETEIQKLGELGSSRLSS